MKKFILLFAMLIGMANLPNNEQSDAEKLAELLNSWDSNNPQYDLNGDGTVNAADLAIFLGQEERTDIGNGFLENTPQPNNNGSPDEWGYDAQAIARWTNVPFTEYNTDFTIGVVAFHICGIQKVDFSVNGGAWKSVYQPKLNSSNNVEEYFISVNPFDTQDGLIEVRAIVYPNIGMPRVLQGSLSDIRVGGVNYLKYKDGNHSLFLNLNSHGTLSSLVMYVSPNGNDTTGNGSEAFPYQSIGKALRQVRTLQNGICDGAKIYLMEGNHQNGVGSYSYPNPTTISRFITIQPAPNLTREQVKLIGVGNYGTKLIQVKNITFYNNDTITSTQIRSGNLDSIISIENCYATYEAYDDNGNLKDPILGSEFSSSFAGAYYINCEMYNTRGTMRSANISINSRLIRPGDTPLANTGLHINAFIDQYVRIGDDHADLVHFFANSGSPIRRENNIFFNITARNFWMQGFQMNCSSTTGTQQYDNTAFINWDVSQDRNSVAGSWWMIDANHLLMENIKFKDQPMRWKKHATDADKSLNIKNVLIKNVCVAGMVDYGNSERNQPYLIEPNVRQLNVSTSGCQ